MRVAMYVSQLLKMASFLPKSMLSSLKAHSCLIQTKGKRSFLTILNEIGHSENKVIMKILLFEDKVGPGVANTPHDF